MDIWTQQIIQLIISGVITASVYAVMGIGLSLIYGISRVFNFAYGSFFTWGAYFAWALFSLFHWMNYAIVFLTVIPAMFFLGIATEVIVVRSLRWRPNWQVTTMMVTLGLAFFMDNMAFVTFGPMAKSGHQHASNFPRHDRIRNRWNTHPKGFQLQLRDFDGSGGNEWDSPCP
jgi:branched-chain amino acid transport system permease protein